MKTMNRPSVPRTAPVALLAALLLSLPAQAAQKPPIPASGVYLGATLPGTSDLLPDPNGIINEVARTPAQFNADMGVHHAIFMAFLDFPDVMTIPGELDRITTFIHDCSSAGAIPAITLQVPLGLNSYTAQQTKDFADFLNSFNMPIFLRWCHEMNGSWYAWGQQPTLYVQKFQEFSTVIHNRAPGVAMVWTPNQAAGYPWAGSGAYANPSLSATDDPYEPYYPGDAFVDWVGFSYYHWGSGGAPDYARGYNQVPWPTEWRDVNGVNDPNDPQKLKQFHDRYAVGHSKPMMIPETAALYDEHNVKGGGATEAAIKQEWINQLYNLSELKTLFPQVKAICWFNIKKFEVEVGGPVDWRLDNVKSYYSNHVADSYFKKAVDSVTIGSAPTMLITPNAYSVTVQYATLENRDIVLSLLDPANGYAWYGAQRQSVMPGQGNVTFTVPVFDSPGANFTLPPNGTTCVWDAIIAPTGGDNSNKLGQDTKPLTVDRTAQDAVTITSAPTMLITPNAYSVTVQYTARQDGEIVLSLLNPANSYAWYGAQRQSVTVGQGTATFTVTVPGADFEAFPPNGTTYVWDAILVPPGGSDSNKFAQATPKPLTVDSTATNHVTFVSAPTEITSPTGTHSVTIAYTAREKGDVILTLMDPANGYAFYGNQKISVEPGQGNATFAVTLPFSGQSFPPNGTTYVWDAIIVKPGKDWQDPLPSSNQDDQSLTINAPADSVTFGSATGLLISPGTYSVTVQYFARQSRDIILSILDPANGYAWYGAQKLSVAPGQGNATFTASIPGADFPTFPPNGTTYVWDAILVPPGGDNSNKLAQAATKPLTVDNAVADNVAFVSAPTALTAEGTYQVTVSYTTREDGDILLNLLDDPAGSNTWYGTRRQSVTAGQGNVTFTVTVPGAEFPNFPPNGKNFVWEALLVPPGADYHGTLSKTTAPLAVGDTVMVVSTPATITSPGTYEVTVAYTARENRDIRLNLLDRANGNAWYGTQVKSILAGQGNTTFTVSVPGEGSQNFPPNGTGYVWEALLVPTGSDWTGKISENSKPVTVDAPPDTVTIASAPATLTAAGTYQVTVQYFARQNRDIVLSLLDPPNDNAWYGMQIKSVPTGQGNATFTVTVPGSEFNFPPNGTTYVWDAIVVPSGLDWHSKVSGDTLPLTVAATATAYDAWKAGVFTASELNDPAISGDLATPAHDGITNLMKYALGLDPMTSGAGSLPTVSEQGGYLTLTYRKNKSATDVTYTVQATGFLVGNSWLPATTVVSETDGGSFWLVTVRDNVTYAGTQRFMRLQVSK